MPRFPVEVMKKRAAAVLRKQRVISAEICGTEADRLKSPSREPLLSLSTSASTESGVELKQTPESSPQPEPEPVELVYNIRYDNFRRAPRSAVLRQDTSRTPLIILPVTFPPLLVDGRMQIIHIPKWKREVGFYWRSCSGASTEVHWRCVRLPWRIWMEKNLGEGEKWTELWIERA